MTTRRQLLGAPLLAALAGAFPVAGCRSSTSTGAPKPMYGLIGKMKAQPGQRDALIAILLDDVGAMPGCHSYVVATEAGDPDAIWITEVWDSPESHRASLSLPAVRAAIERAKPMIASFESHVETQPVGGHGLPRG